LRLISERLLSAVRAAAQANPASLRMLRTATWTPPVRRASRPVSLAGPVGASVHQVVVIASSTGGPRALATLVPRLPRSLPAAVLVVQHMPPGFTKSLAARLDGMSEIRVTEAEDGEPIERGHLYLAPGGSHMTVRVDAPGTSAVIALESTAPVWGVRPAADVLFKSAALAFGASTLSVVLTGMGRDGAEGSRSIRVAGGRVFVQDRESSTIFGMPQSTLKVAGADRVLALSDIGPAIAELTDATIDVR
jgi:two-component system chemotaxis response regulator CheB